MRRWFTVLSIVTLGVASCAVESEKKVAEPVTVREADMDVNDVELAPPGPLDDEWCRSLVGAWEVFAESDLADYKGWVKGTGVMEAEMGLGGQFLVIRKEGRITEISDEYLRHLKEDLHSSEQDIEALRNMTFGDIELHSIDPRTGQVVAYLFDSWRCVAEGAGTREGDKETIQWKWSLAGRGTSVRTTERVGNDKLAVVEKYSLPDGGTMEDRIRMVRKRSVPSDSSEFAAATTR
ncbi:MAG: hypothetical protein A2Y77_08095 [Planctomycetes bacterium RBG_13_62_9]|nr:MAG: hypothetical protein A2Y77_08095 [Planctomycetes bacterium RBG_13_62_9]